jgi:hypothetical protein
VYRLLLLALAFTGLATAWDPLPTVDLARLRPSDFTDRELDMPFYLAHFRELAASVVESGADRGFINIPVWRSVRDNKPYNSRIMESILSLAYFYTLDRPWNPYHGSPALRQRLEAALAYWLKQQSPEGRFAEAAPQRWNLAATAFSTKFIGQTLTYLKSGPPIDPELLQRVISADRKTIHLVLTAPDLIKYGTFVSNQYTNVFAGGFAYLKLYPDPELESILRKRFADGMHEHQSPAGYFYEEDGPDFEYDLFTHQSNLAMAWDYVRGTNEGKMIVDQERKWFQWLSYNAVPNGDWTSWILDQAIGTRTRRDAIPGKDSPVGEMVPEEHAFATSREALQQDTADERLGLEFLWPRVPALTPGTYSPYAFLLRDHRSWFPSDAQREAARHNLPYFARRNFNHQLADDRHPQVFTYVRHPRYYAAFGAGKQLSTHRQQRFGLGLLWNEDMGAVLISVSGSSTAAWGTLAHDAPQVYEAAELNPTYRVSGAAVQPKPGSFDLPQGVLAISYSLGTRGEKSLEFRDDGIVVTVRHPGEFTEVVPLLQAGDDPPVGFTVKPDGAAPMSRSAADALVGGRKLSVVRIEGKDSLTYRLAFAQ